MGRDGDPDPTPRGTTSLELVTALSVGMVVTGAALALLSTGNRWVAGLLREHDHWQRVQAAATLWASEWRGAGYDPRGSAGAAITRLTPESLDFSADWNASGDLLPTPDNPNERLSWAAAPGLLRRGVNGGPRVAIAWPDSLRFVYRASSGAVLGDRPGADEAVIAEVRIRPTSAGGAPGPEIVWAAARRNP